MGAMFDKEWLTGFYTRWNDAPEMTELLRQAKFNSLIAFGYPDGAHPRIAFKVEDGKIVKATLASTSDSIVYDWDLRAAPEQWEAWRQQPLTIIGLGPAVAQGRLQFKSGDYRAMIRQMRLAKAFLHMFTLL